MNDNLYQPPQSDLAEKNDQYQHPGIFGWKGRLGRVFYLGLTIGSFISAFLVSLSLYMLYETDSSSIFMLICFAYWITLNIRRLHDINLSGWFSLLGLIPIANFFVFLFMIFAPGTPEQNRFGDPTAKNSGKQLLLVIFPLALLAVLLHYF